MVHMGMGLGETVAKITAVVTVDNAGLKKGLAEAESETKKSGDRMGKLSKAAGAATAAGFAVIGVALVDSIKGAEALQTKMAVLDNTLKRSGATHKQIAGTLDYLTKRSDATGTSVDDLADSFGKLDSVTGNVTRAHKLLAEAQNIATQKNISLAAATKLVVSVEQGKTTMAQKQFGLLPKVTTAEDKLKKTYDLQAASGKKLTVAEKEHYAEQMKAAKAADLRATGLKAQGLIAGKVAGAQAAYDKTAAGQQAILQQRFKNTEDELGTKLLPVVEKLLGFISSHTNVVIALAVALGGLWAAITVVTTATKVWTAVQWLWNAAMDANPIGLVVIAIAALVAGVILAYTHFSKFRDIVNGVFGWLKGAAVDVINFVKQHWQLILAILVGPFGVAVLEIRDHWATIKGDAQDVVAWFRSMPGKVGNALSGMGGAIVGAFSGVGGSIASAVKGAFNYGVIDPANNLIDRLVSIEKHIPGSPNLHIGNDPIPRLATGGMIVPGVGNGDKVRALLEPGEGIINKRAVTALGGPGAINAINAAVPRFATGGVVPNFQHQLISLDRQQYRDNSEMRTIDSTIAHLDKAIAKAEKHHKHHGALDHQRNRLERRKNSLAKTLTKLGNKISNVSDNLDAQNTYRAGLGATASNLGVTVIQNITTTNPDPFTLARRAAFAASAAM